MSPKTRHSTPDPLIRPLAIVVFFVVIIRATAALLPPGRLWGADFLRYLDPAWGVCFSLVPLIVLSPWFRRLFDSLSSSTADALFSALAIACLVGMLFFPMDTFYYGDGSILVPEVARISQHPRFGSEILLNLKSSPLAGLMIERCAAWGPAMLEALGFGKPGSPLFAFRIFDILLFILLVIILVAYTKGVRRLTAFLSLCGTAGMILFFGYAEFYAAVGVAIVWYILAAERYIKGEGRLWILAASFLVSIACHYYAVVLLPSIVWIIAEKRGWRPALFASTRRMILAIGVAVAACIAGYFAMGWNDSSSRVVMPIAAQHSAAGTQSYTLLSSAHLLDLVNLPILLAPVPFAFLLILVASRSRKMFIESAQFRFLCLSGLGLAAFFTFANATLGLARDWDMTAPMGLFFGLAALLLSMSLAGKRSPSSVAMLSIASLLTMLPWLAVHLDTGRATRRFADVMELDAAHMYGDYALSGYEALRKYYLHTGNLDGEILTTQRMIDVLHYPQHYILLHQASEALADADPGRHLALQQWLLNRVERKATQLRNMGRNSDYGTSLTRLDSLATMIASAALNRGIAGQLADDLERVCSATGRRTPFLLIEGLHALGADHFTEAAEKLSTVRGNGYTTNRLRGLCGVALLHTADAQHGRALVDSSLRADPNDPVIHYYLGYTLLVLHADPHDAAVHLRETVRLTPGTDLGKRAEMILRRLGS
jgi:hypothetical protein